MALARFGLANAAIDISDGLGVDAARLARASRLRAVLDRKRVPVSPAVAALAQREGVDPLDWILGGGDDYELLFAVPESAAGALGELEAGVPLTRIGQLEPGSGAVLRAPEGDRDVGGLGYDHFESSP
jgi:thiamine-monophosphate kinase